MTLERELFVFENGDPMNGFYAWKKLTRELPTEAYVCWRLARGAGPLGWSKSSFQAAHVPMEMVKATVQQGIIREMPLLEIARTLVSNKDAVRERQILEQQGGFLGAGKDDRKFIYDFDQALDAVRVGETPETLEIRYQIANQVLSDFIGMLLD